TARFGRGNGVATMLDSLGPAGAGSAAIGADAGSSMRGGGIGGAAALGGTTWLAGARCGGGAAASVFDGPRANVRIMKPDTAVVPIAPTNQRRRGRGVSFERAHSGTTSPETLGVTGGATRIRVGTSWLAASGGESGTSAASTGNALRWTGPSVRRYSSTAPSSL